MAVPADRGERCRHDRHARADAQLLRAPGGDRRARQAGDTLGSDPLRLIPRRHANVYRLMLRCDEAVDDYKQAIAIAPNQIAAHLGLPICYAQTGQIEFARMQGREILPVSPKFDMALYAKSERPVSARFATEPRCPCRGLCACGRDPISCRGLRPNLLVVVFALVELIDRGGHVGDERDAIASAFTLQDPRRLVRLRGLSIALGALRGVAFVALRPDLVGDDVGRVFLRRAGEDPCPAQRGKRSKQQRHASSHGGFHNIPY